jgi:hypothetical protein
MSRAASNVCRQPLRDEGQLRERIVSVSTSANGLVSLLVCSKAMGRPAPGLSLLCGRCHPSKLQLPRRMRSGSARPDDVRATDLPGGRR